MDVTTYWTKFWTFCAGAGVALLLLAVVIQTLKLSVISVVVAVMTVPAGWLLWKKAGPGGLRLAERHRYLCLGVVLATGLLLRLGWLLAVRTVPSSDFGHIHEYAVRTLSGDYTTMAWFWYAFPFKINCGLLLSAWYSLTGPSALWAGVGNALCALLTAGVVWRMLIPKTPSGAWLALLLLTFWPAGITYGPVVATEYPAVAFLVLAAALLWRAAERSRRGEMGLMLAEAVLAAFSLCASQLLRPSAMLLLAAVAFAAMALIQAPGSVRIRVLGLVAATALIFSGLMTGSGLLTRQLTGVDASRASSAMNILIGVNTQSRGWFSQTDFERVREADQNFDKVHHAALLEAEARVRANPAGVLRMLPGKFLDMWGSETYGTGWSLETSEDTALSALARQGRTLLNGLAQGWYALVLLLVLAGICRHRRGLRLMECSALALIMAMIPAYLILEVQPRYHFPAVVMLMILAGSLQRTVESGPGERYNR